jgi:tetratricopeptide (TPR) repeat protein
MKRHLSQVAAFGMCFLAPITCVYAQQVRADTGSIAIGGSVSGSTVIIGIPQEKVDELVRDAKRPLEELTAQQRENIALLKEKLDLNERQVRAALGIVGENDVPPERLTVKLVEIAENFKALRETASAQPGDDPKIVALKADAQKAIDAGELAKADALLADVETEQRRAHDRFAMNEAETSARRGDIALTRLRYAEAAKHFANAAAVFPPNSAYEERRISYLEREARALYQQGDELGDNGALLSAIQRGKRLLELIPRKRQPLRWARIQHSLGMAFVRLGERESGTARFEEAVAAFREALMERTRERVPLDWAMTQNNLGIALRELGEKESGTAKLEEAVAAYREVLKEWTRERAPLDWARGQNNLGLALRALGGRETGTAKLEEAVATYGEALKERTRERVPLYWAATQHNLGNALRALGGRESGTAKLEEAVAAYREALKERTRERVPLEWARSFGDEGIALMFLAERRGDVAMATTALSQINTAFETMRDGGEASSAAFYKQQLPKAHAIVARLRAQ